MGKAKIIGDNLGEVKMNSLEIAKAYSRLFPMASFKKEDWPLRKIIIDLCCDGVLNLNEADCLLNSFKEYNIIW